MREFSIQPEFPGEDALQAYGGLSFLYLRSPRHAAWPVKNLRLIIQPPIDLHQSRIFYHEGVPRAACTWAHLSDEAQARVIKSDPITPSQWRSGRNLWLMEIIAPYNQGSGARVFRTFMRHVPQEITRFRYLRVDADGSPPRIMQVDRPAGSAWRAPRVIQETDLFKPE